MNEWDETNNNAQANNVRYDADFYHEICYNKLIGKTAG